MDETALPFRAIADLVRAHAQARPEQAALREGERSLSYGALDALMDRVAAALQRDGARAGHDAVAICAAASIEYAAVFLGALRAGVAVAPLAPGSTPEQLAAMVADAGATHLFVDEGTAGAFADDATAARRIALDAAPAAGRALDAWLAPAGALPETVSIDPQSPFNIIYSSGTTGTPKGIVQSHAMRWAHVQRADRFGYGPATVTLLATPLYSNTTLVVFFPTLAAGAASC